MLTIFGSMNILNAAMLGVGALLLLKKIVDMNRFHVLRVVLLTLLFSCIVIYFFLVYGFTLGNPIRQDCVLCEGGYCHTMY